MRSIRFLVAAIALVAPAALSAQQRPSLADTARVASGAGPARPGDVTKTFQLHHLGNVDAVKLLTPYINGRGWVYQMGTGMHAVTVSGTPAALADAAKILGEYDRSPVTLTLNFQLVAADSTKTRDPAVAGLDSVLRGVLKFSGYHLLTAAVATVSEGDQATQTLTTGADRNFTLTCRVSDVSGEGADATAHLVVELRRLGADRDPSGMVTPNPLLFNTGVTIPIGNTVVLGSTVEGVASRGLGERALILTVRPTVDATKRRD